ETGDEMAAIDPTALLVPASNMKLITTAAALDLLGPDFNFSTELRLAEDGRLIVRGDGDPAFGDPVLLKTLNNMDVDALIGTWVGAIRKLGRRKFKQLIVDDRIFDQQWVHPRWPTDQLHRWYCAQVAGLNFNDNCVDLYTAPLRPGQAPKLSATPSRAPILLVNKAKSGSRNAVWATRGHGGNEITVRGSVRHALTEPIPVTIHDPPLFFARTLQRHLKAAGIEVEQVRRARPAETIPRGTLLAAVQTSLPTVITRTNRDSQNLFAEALLKRLGYRITHLPGSWSTGAAAVRMFLIRRLGVDAAEIIMDDGSGLSPDNRVSARLLSRLLVHIHQNPRLAPTLRRSLARPGQAGTLKRRFTDVKLVGEVYAKSGYISGVVALSGYLLHDDDRGIAFSMLLNDYHKSTYVAKKMMERIVAAADRHLAATAPARLGG
ncbi:MAG: D-alanyl-D-alanine carboxypeptidase/D-alanyl-D-alanine-endopeptidase, partial [Phycisphaerae bacterium]|nr:D-alanyl-D-alanine carboxypeptidase/D-alanyl-D-alanine-endopeptidase [Phycisphaerae bacterium]